MSFALSQHNLAPDQWRDVLRLAQEANADGADLRGQVGGRPLNLLIGFQTFHPFLARPTYLKIADLPLAERVVELRRPEVREAILSETSPASPFDAVHRHRPRPHLPDRRAARLRAHARPEHRRHRRARADATREAVLYDVMLAHDGRELVMKALLGYSYGNLDDMREMILHPNAALGLSDGGAHCGAICDASASPRSCSRTGPATATAASASRSSSWSRSSRATPPGSTASATGASSAPGYRADLNVIDFDALSLALPRAGPRPARWCPSPHPARRRLPLHLRRRRGDHARRRGDRRPPRQARAGHAMSGVVHASERPCSGCPGTQRASHRAGAESGEA